MLGMISGGNSQTGGSARFLASTSWTVPANVGRIWVRVIGGGAGGGSSHGGGGGGHVFVGPLLVVPGTVIPLTVGAGGATGVDGSGSSFGSNITAGAGKGSGDGGAAGDVPGGNSSIGAQVHSYGQVMYASGSYTYESGGGGAGISALIQQLWGSNFGRGGDANQVGQPGIIEVFW